MSNEIVIGVECFILYIILLPAVFLETATLNQGQGKLFTNMITFLCQVFVFHHIFLRVAQVNQ